MQHEQHTTERGYILLMSVLVVSIILSISFGIYALALKDVILASYLKDSAKAFGAADKGIECALYWDRSTPQNGRSYTIFTTSTQYVAESEGGAIKVPFCDTTAINTAAASWTAVNAPDPLTGMTNFSLTFPDNTCADISVFKEANSTTTIVSNGYNTCIANARRTQRTIQVTNSDGGDAAFAVSATCPFAAVPGSVFVANFATDPGTYGGAPGRRVRDDQTFAEAHMFVPLALPAGSYRVRTYMYDSSVSRASENEPSERVYISVRDFSETLLAQVTTPTSDLADGVGSASLTETLDNAFIVPAGVTLVKVYHYLNEQFDLGNPVSLANKNDFQPICVEFTKN